MLALGTGLECLLICTTAVVRNPDPTFVGRIGGRLLLEIAPTIILHGRTRALQRLGIADQQAPARVGLRDREARILNGRTVTGPKTKIRRDLKDWYGEF